MTSISYSQERQVIYDRLVTEGQLIACKEFEVSTRVSYFKRPDFDIPILYRYGKRAHLKKLLDEGSLRLSTLYSYSNLESLGEAQFDEGEGGLRYTIRGAECPTAISVTSIDCWTFCMSRDLSRSLVDAFEADCVVEIQAGFHTELCKAVACNCGIAALNKIKYLSEDSLSNLVKRNEPAPFAREIKNDRFSYQNEYRLCLEPKAPSGPVYTPSSNSETGFGLKLEHIPYSATEKILRTLNILEPLWVTRKELTKFVSEVTP